MLCAFDFDGTLANSRPIYYQAVRMYAKANDLKIPDEATMDIVMGNPNPSIVFEGWGSLEEFIQHMNKVYAITDDLSCQTPSDLPLYDGIKDLLNDLKRDHFTISLVTSRSLKPIQVLIDHHKIKDFFTTIRTEQDVFDRGYRGKPYPDKLNCVLKEVNCSQGQAVMIGDTLMDITMAKQAGVKAIGVAWGYHHEPTLRAHGADHIVSTPDVLNRVIRECLVQGK